MNRQDISMIKFNIIYKLYFIYIMNNIIIIKINFTISANSCSYLKRFCIN